MAAVGAVHVWVTDCATTLNKDKTEATKVVSMVLGREEPLESLVRHPVTISCQIFFASTLATLN